MYCTFYTIIKEWENTYNLTMQEGVRQMIYEDYCIYNLKNEKRISVLEWFTENIDSIIKKYKHEIILKN